MTPYASSIAGEMQRALVAAGNPDGGWGYAAGRTSRLEPTCWAVLALPAGRDAAPFFSALPRDSHLFAERSNPQDGGTVHPANLAFNGLAAVLLAHNPSLVASAVRTAHLQALASGRWQRLRVSPLQHDTALPVWPWVDGTSSWVEPTAWCRLALRRAPADAATAARLDRAVDLLRDQACASGGWNHGDARAFGRDLRPHVPVTALALLALQDQQHQEFVSRSLSYLRDHQLAERSGMALALVVIALSVLRENAAAARRALLEEWQCTRYLGSLCATAMALFAVTADDHELDAFRI